METIQAIQKLLFLEDYLIIPGLGGFVSQYHPAVIDTTTGTFTPPVKEIVFTSELVQNDGTLVNFIAGENNISADKAREQIDRFVAETRKKLKQGDRVFITGIGQFVVDRDYIIRFQTDPGINLFLESFGLASFHLHEVVHENHPGSGKSAISLPDESPRTVEFALTKKKRTHQQTNIRRVAIAVPLLIAFSLLPYNSRITQTLVSSKASLIPETSLFRLDYPDALRRDTARLIVYPITDSAATENVIPDSLAPADTVKEAVKEVAVKSGEVKVPEGKYAVIAGCFKIKDNAERLHKQLVEKGYPAIITTSRNGLLFKVNVQSFATRQEAVSGLSRIKKSEPGLELWIAL